MEEVSNLNYIKGKTLENNVAFLFKTAGFETYKNQFLSKYEIDVLVKIGDRSIIVECKNYQNSMLTIRNLIHQWHSKNKIIKADKVILVLAGLNIKDDDNKLASEFNIQIWDEQYLTDLFKLSLNPSDLKKHILENIDLKHDIDIAVQYRNEIKKLIVFPLLTNVQENTEEEVYNNFNNWLRRRVRTDLRLNLANLNEINNHIELFEDTKQKKVFFIFNVSRGEQEYWEELKTRLTNSTILPEETRKKYFDYMKSLVQEYKTQLEYYDEANEEFYNRLINARISLLLENEYDTCLIGPNENEIIKVEHIGDLQFKISLKSIDEHSANVISWLMTSEYHIENDKGFVVYSWISTDISETSLKVYRILNEYFEINGKRLRDYALNDSANSLKQTKTSNFML